MYAVHEQFMFIEESVHEQFFYEHEPLNSNFEVAKKISFFYDFFSKKN